jgi:hypothetical protein
MEARTGSSFEEELLPGRNDGIIAGRGRLGETALDESLDCCTGTGGTGGFDSNGSNTLGESS